ncbi:endonuclease/exonuclease/phosphatase family protein [Loktanella sp. IMCC34160]|uniref:endonuclease/exonuclease/phosphatase family protein n=1 Tax=Loktanella sp. IMCC34160 TaxID=2510646 RepID=UPI0013E9E041|nr:endonuclease/exonuclease/phosphatase family protein [Loktanella sp. IMCC34160]
MRALWGLLAVIGLVVLALTHLGAAVPLGDALAVLRPHVILLGVPVVLGLLLARLGRVALVALAAVSASAWFTYSDWHGTADRLTGTGALSIYQKNLLWNGTDRDALLQDIRTSDADFVTLQEVSRENAAIVDGLADLYPHRQICQSAGNGGIAILSRHPLQDGQDGCRAGEGIILARADLPNGDSLWIGSVHLNWPFPYDQARQVPGVIRGLAALDEPVLIGGDFNMVPWGSAVRQIARAARADRVGGYGSTFPGFGWFAPLAIDHVLVPDGTAARAEVRPRFGSDHLGVLVRLDLPGQAPSR